MSTAIGEPFAVSIRNSVTVGSTSEVGIMVGFRSNQLTVPSSLTRSLL